MDQSLPLCNRYFVNVRLDNFFINMQVFIIIKVFKNITTITACRHISFSNFHFLKSEINKNLYVDQKTHMQTFIFF